MTTKRGHAFTDARLEQEKLVQAQPNYGPPLVVLGLIDAALGRKEEALREGRRAVELLPDRKEMRCMGIAHDQVSGDDCGLGSAIKISLANRLGARRSSARPISAMAN